MKLEINDPAPWFIIPSNINPDFHFDTVGGRKIVLFFFGSSVVESVQIVLKNLQDFKTDFEQLDVSLFGVSIDPEDEHQKRAEPIAPNLTFFWDFHKKVSQNYGICQTIEYLGKEHIEYTPCTFILNENLRIINILPLQSPEDYVQNILAFIQALPPKISPSKNMGIHPPILRIPNVLDKDFCNHLIKLYRADGGGPSGFMRQLDGKTIGVLDSTFKRRRDLLIEDQSLKEKINNLVKRRIQPEIKKSYQFDISRFERYLIACYDESDKGFFRAHRDNTSSGTIHRKFAMTLNLNTGEYEGGYLWFPEYGPLYYRPEIGEAIIFSCSLLHEATPVIKGQRFTLLSFFYGEEDVTIREKNKHLIVHA